ncbi:MAG: hypothetical protein HKN23_11745 [Verrucomicrobiales bacterium]|nr:hypothetical protein [Verrucomicrobiales bacterium]
MQTSIIAAVIYGWLAALLPASETEPVKKPGVTLRFVTEENAILPGKPITVGLFLEHEPEYHTYWKSPGIVGVATRLEWKLPEGFSAGEIQWPAPQRTKMAQITAYGYETDTCLISEIHVPDVVAGDKITLKARLGLMCCAASCHPAWHDMEITLPVLRDGSKPKRDEKWAKVMAAARAKFPKKAPDSWRFSARRIATEDPEIHDVEIGLALPEEAELPDGFDWAKTYFFCHDNQVHSDQPQKISADGKSVLMNLKGTEFAPKNPEGVSGVLFHPAGWTGLNTKWIEVFVRWPGKKS